MSKITEWAEKRNNALLKASLLEKGVDLRYFLNEIEKEQGKKAREVFALKLLKAIGLEAGNENDLIKNQTIFQKKFDSKIDEIIKKSESENALKIIIKNLMDFAYADLEKMAIKADDKSIITDAAIDTGEETVSSEFHKKNYPAPKEYKQFLEDPKILPNKADSYNGVATKLIHKLRQKTYMTKPYHTHIDYSTQTFTKDPISGWATIATKALFNAGNIGNLCENVGVDKIDNYPVTVHEFDSSAEHLCENPEKNQSRVSTPSSLQFKQIALMDFLTNNIDRHYKNIMQAAPDKNGNENLLAIDHERNFQYHRNHKFKHHNTLYPPTEKALDKPASVSLQDFISKANGIEPYYKAFIDKAEKGIEKKGYKDLHEWWKTNSKSIKDSFIDHVKEIKDESIRQHVMENFLQRHASVDEWAKRMDEPEKYQTLDLPAIKDLIRRKPIEVPELENLIKDKNLTDSVKTLNDVVYGYEKRGKVLNFKTKRAIDDTIAKVIKRSAPNEVKDLFLELYKNESLSDSIVSSEIEDNLVNFLIHSGSTPHLKSAIDAINAILQNKNKDEDNWDYERLMDQKMKLVEAGSNLEQVA
jgi:hypothetical protein